MKKLAFLLIVLFTLNAFGQKILKIEIDNPEPRVGQQVTFSINVDFLTNYFKKEVGKNVEFTRSTSIFGNRSDDFERVIIFEKAKTYKIGPFDFEFNGNKYTTEIIEVNVLPKLPMEEGLWLRKTVFNGQQYLILEQLISNVSNRTEQENGGYSVTIGGVKPEDKEFAELKDLLVEGIEANKYSSSSTTLRPDETDLLDVGFSYSIKKYKVEFEENFSEEYFISEKDFINLPDKFDIGKINLKK